MKMKPKITLSIAGALIIAALTTAGVTMAQAPAITRTIITKADVSVPNREALIVRAEIAPGGVAGWHTHPGEEISYVLEGESTLMVAGQPPRKIAAGQGFVIPAGVVHNAKNDSATVSTKVLAVYVVEKDKPLVSPAPAPAQ
jgi:quercetin dioxygenase-like cupin family protein